MSVARGLSWPVSGALVLGSVFGAVALAALVEMLVGVLVGVLVGAPPSGTPRDRVTAPPHRVDLSTATAAELSLLAEVGPSLAARIAADRALHGGFATVDALSRVKGVGPATLDAVRGEARAGRMP